MKIGVLGLVRYSEKYLEKAPKKGGGEKNRIVVQSLLSSGIQLHNSEKIGVISLIYFCFNCPEEILLC